MKNNNKTLSLLLLILYISNSSAMEDKVSLEKDNEILIPEIWLNIASFATTLEDLENMLKAMPSLISTKAEANFLLEEIYRKKFFLKEYDKVTKKRLTRFLFTESFMNNYGRIKFLCMKSELLENGRYLISELLGNIIKHNDIKKMTTILNSEAYNKRYITLNGMTPLQFALKLHKKEMSSLLIKYNIKNNWLCDSTREITDLIQQTKQDDAVYVEMGLPIPNRDNLAPDIDPKLGRLSKRLF